ncbi:MAG TPA: VOC family protein [Pyrinomonadaceae bacterium]|nr:VOC family protein [Pyrinomonadaceae bacterium]
MTSFKPYAVRYQVKDVARSEEFYTRHLGFKQEGPSSPAFSMVANGDLRLLLSGPGASGSRPMPDGRVQESGGWNRIVIGVDDIKSAIAELKTAGLTFRNDVEDGPGGSQIQIEDPDGNPIEIFQPAHKAARQ